MALLWKSAAWAWSAKKFQKRPKDETRNPGGDTGGHGDGLNNNNTNHPPHNQ